MSATKAIAHSWIVRRSDTSIKQVYMVGKCGRLLAIQFVPKMVDLCLIMYMAYSVFKVYDIYHLWYIYSFLWPIR